MAYVALAYVGNQTYREVAHHYRSDGPTTSLPLPFRMRQQGSPPASVQAVHNTPAAGLHPAATTLLKVMVDFTTPPSTRVRAAEAVMSHTAKAIEIEDIDAR